jgi:competence protein ComEC
MLSGISGFISGVIVLYFYTELINTSPYSLIVTLILTAVCVLLTHFFSTARHCKKTAQASLSVIRTTRFRRALFYGAGLVAGFAYAYHHCHAVKSAILPADYDNQILLLDGFLCGLPRESEFSRSAEFCINSLSTETGERIAGEGFKAYLRWPLEDSLPLQHSVLRIEGRQPRATVNFTGFAYETNLFYKGIVLTGKVVKSDQVEVPGSLNGLQTIRHRYHLLRSRLAELCDVLFEGAEHRGMLRALILGDRSQLSVADHKLLGLTGTQHLIAISGLHVGIVMFGLYLLLPKSLASTLILAVIGGIYVLLVGFGPSAQRAWIMCLLGLLYAEGYLRRGRGLIYLLALFLVLLIDPLAPLNAGFWFSFICVAILLLAANIVKVVHHPWWVFVFIQLVLMLGMAPIYGELGMPNGAVNMLANLIAVPWISLLILPVALGAFVLAYLVFGLSDVLDGLLESIFIWLDHLIEWLMVYLASLRLFPSDWLLAPVAVLQASYVVCLLGFWAMARFTSIGLCILSVLLLVIIFPDRMGTERDELLIFDAGQGLAMAMSFDSQTWIYDSGPAYGRLSTVDQVILPHLRARRLLNHTRGVIISHGDADHAGDVSSLIRALDQPHLISGEPERLSADDVFQPCSAGMRWQTTSASIEVLYPFVAINTDSLIVEDAPQSAFPAVSAPVSNNRSCVVRFTLHGKTFLFMGDVEGDAELALVRHYRHQLKADVLIAGHHGALKGTSYALLKHVLPEYVVFSAGFQNAFGHPSVQVVERIENMNAHSARDGTAGARMVMLNTAETGALRFEVDIHARQLSLESARGTSSLFWLGSANPI